MVWCGVVGCWCVGVWVVVVWCGVVGCGAREPPALLAHHGDGDDGSDDGQQQGRDVVQRTSVPRLEQRLRHHAYTHYRVACNQAATCDLQPATCNLQQSTAAAVRPKHPSTQARQPTAAPTVSARRPMAQASSAPAQCGLVFSVVRTAGNGSSKPGGRVDAMVHDGGVESRLLPTISTP